jgi:hypothetical protein
MRKGTTETVRWLEERVAKIDSDIDLGGEQFKVHVVYHPGIDEERLWPKRQ